MNAKRILYPLLLAYPTLAFAHTTQFMSGGFQAGFMHPLTGLDHALAMLAVGVLAQQWGGIWQWRLPIIFLACMLLGGIAGIMHVPFPFAELGIGASVILLGFLVSFPKQTHHITISMMVGIFALCHGHSHGEEMHHFTSPIGYVSGFLVAAILLHLTGYSVARFAHTFMNDQVMRVGGVAMTLFGIWIF